MSSFYAYCDACGRQLDHHDDQHNKGPITIKGFTDEYIACLHCWSKVRNMLGKELEVTENFAYFELQNLRNTKSEIERKIKFLDEHIQKPD